MRRLSACLLALAAAWGAVSHAGASALSAELNRAASLYHQSRYDSSLALLETLLARPGAQRRDSLAILHYLGMGRSRLGEDAEARSRFAELLALDSLFRLPSNEDPRILSNFDAALADVQSGPPADARSRTAGAVAPVSIPLRSDPADPMLALAPYRTDAEGSAFAASPRPAAGAPAGRPGMSLAMGAIPLGGGWIARRRMGHGLVLGLLQAGGVLLAAHASGVQSRAQNDPFGLEEHERARVLRWQAVQRLSLGTAAGAYLYSLIASGGD